MAAAGEAGGDPYIAGIPNGPKEAPSMLIALIVIALIVVFAIFTYNRLVTLRQAWKRAFADIDVRLKQGQDLVPNLGETVKGYASHESSVFIRVREARAAA